MNNSPTDIRSSRSSERRTGILCIGLDPNAKDNLEFLITQAPGAHVVDNVDHHVTPREAMRLLEQFRHKICVIDFDEGEESLRVARSLHDACDNNVTLFAISSDSNPDQIITAMRCGCSEYLLKPLQPDQVLEALAHIEARRQGSLPGQKGRVISLMGAKGGTGVTSLALHLALSLVRRHQQKVLLVDHHPTLGDAALCLGMNRHQYSFYELVHNMDRLDVDLLQGFLLQHPSGLEVLDSPQAIQSYSETPADAIEQTLSFLAENYQYIVVDCPPGLSEDTCASIRQSDRLELIVTPELPAIQNAIRCIEYLTGLHYPSENIDIVLNRASRKNALTERDVESSLHREISVRVPNNYSQIVTSINAGMPLDMGRSDLPLIFDQWADLVVGHEAAAAATAASSNNGKGSRKKLFTTLFGS
jgi:pilus assembly protein CpaE